MKFGIFYELQLPRPWDGDAEHDLIQNALGQIELADQLGFDHAWEVEHHFLEEYSHSSAPEVFLAAASQRTKNIRLGHGIVQLPTNHPARVAERVSTLDLVSSGRVELGLGEGSSITELHPFGRRFRDKRLVFEDAVKCLMPMFGDEPAEYHGEYFDFPLRNVLPKPKQKPHPPLWVACSQLDTIEQAGRWGFGALGFQFASADAANAWVNAYYHAYVNDPQRITAYVTNPNISVVCGFMCAPTDEEAHERAEGWTFFQFSLGFYSRYGVVEPGTVNLWDEYQKWKAEPGNAAKSSGGLIGSPATIRGRLRKFEDTNIDQVILLNQAGKNTNEHIRESLELFAAEVMPEFHEREPEHQEWKRKILNGEIEIKHYDLDAYRMRSNQTPTLKHDDTQLSDLSAAVGRTT
jgi:alkanesulfonate monooxygenase SsuD/methylene tetrahydromethanopterin reductase-like flavin-dependent oxidoreductase (luciferase family)